MGVTPVKANLMKWSFADKNDDKCDYGEMQDMDMNHIFTCTKRLDAPSITPGAARALDMAQFWVEKKYRTDGKAVYAWRDMATILNARLMVAILLYTKFACVWITFLHIYATP